MTETEPGSDETTAEQGPPPETAERDRLSPALIATLVTIPTMVIIGFIVFAALKNREAAQIPIEGYSTSADAADGCGPLIAALPETFEGYGGKQIEGNTVRWAPDSGDQSADPIVFRCGVARPEGLAPTSALQVINAAQWFQTESVDGRGQAWVLVDRRPYVAVWVPAGAGNAPLTQVSNLSDDLTPMPLDFGN